VDLKIKDVAELLNISETTVRRLLAEGKIPSYRINQQYRFCRGDIQNWVMNYKQEHASSENPLKDIQNKLATPKVIGTHPSGGIKQFSLYRALHKGIFLHDVAGHSKEDVIRNAVHSIADDLSLDADVLFDLLWDRERLQPTALNNGIGIPHTRDFLLQSPHDAVCIGFPNEAVDYGALDGKHVHTLFFLFACDDKRHLHLLAKIALLCSQPATIDLLLSRPSKEVFLEYIKNWESSMT